MHIVYMRIGKTVFKTVPDTLFAPMEQAIHEESLFLWVCEFIWEPIPNLGQESLHLGCKGRDRLFLSLVCMVKVPYKQIKGLYITIYNGKFLNYCVQWDTGSQISNSVCCSTSQGVLYALPQFRITVGLPESLELIAPLLKGDPSFSAFPTESRQFGDVGSEGPIL